MTLSARETILNLFREAENGFVSGARISQRLGVSRTAVWKQIESLRELGYQIEAVPSRGYQLVHSPDLILPEEVQAGLKTSVVGRQIRCFETIESTNTEACALAEQGADEGLVVIAEQQSAGKGRMGRRWISPAQVNLYASILLRPSILPVEASQLTFLSAVAVCRAIEEVSGLKASVKWPNDVLIAGRKVAGLLNEMSSETDRVNYVILGVGVNLNMKADQFPGNLRYPATSVAIETGDKVSRVAFTRALLGQLDALYADYRANGPGPIHAAWAELCEMTGQEIVVDCQSMVIRGIMQGLDHDGALLVKTANGYERVLAGDVRPVRGRDEERGTRNA